MTETEFNNIVDATYQLIEDAVDAAEQDLDYENSGGVLTVDCENGSSLIFSRQLATSELWLASRSGGYHYCYDEAAQCWRSTREGLSLREQLRSDFLAQSGVALDIAV